MLVLNPPESVRPSETTYHLPAPCGVREEIVLEPLDRRLQFVEDFATLTVTVDLRSQRCISQPGDGVVHLAAPPIVVSEVLQFFAGVVRGSAHVVHRCSVHLCSVDRLPAPHAGIYFWVSAHDDADVFGRRAASIG